MLNFNDPVQKDEYIAEIQERLMKTLFFMVPGIYIMEWFVPVFFPIKSLA